MLRVVRLLMVALVALLAVFVAETAGAQVPEAITINSKGEIKLRPYTPAPTAKAFASVILLAGGNGVLDLNMAGDIRELQGNFLIRSARRFLNAGLNVAMLDAEPDAAGPTGLTNQRHTKSHGLHLHKMIGAVRTQWPKKAVWLVGTSNGAISAVSGAFGGKGGSIPGLPPIFSELPDGIVLTSSVTAPDAPDGELHFVTEPDLGLSKITVPTLVVWHKEDICPFSHKTNAPKVLAELVSVPKAKKSEIVIEKGAPNVAMSLCSAFGFHGFNGAEDSVVGGIAKFIKLHSP